MANISSLRNSIGRPPFLRATSAGSPVRKVVLESRSHAGSRSARIGGNTRVEAATGESSYARVMTEFSVMRGLTKRSQLGITASTGTTVGDLPVQRNWFLGGPYTVHGHRAGTVAGNAFWLARAELSAGKPMVPPVLFAGAGWAGDRRDIQRASPTIAGAGLGLSMISGLELGEGGGSCSPIAHSIL